MMMTVRDIYEAICEDFPQLREVEVKQSTGFRCCFTFTVFGKECHLQLPLVTKARTLITIKGYNVINEILEEFGIETTHFNVVAFVILHEYGHYIRFNNLFKRDGVTYSIDTRSQYEELNRQLRRNNVSDYEAQKAYRQLPNEKFADMYAIGVLKYLLEMWEI